MLSFSHTTTLVKDFFEEIRNMMSSAESSAPPLSYSLKTLFLPVADGTDLEDVIRQVQYDELITIFPITYELMMPK